jgi:hypothetical protein
MVAKQKGTRRTCRFYALLLGVAILFSVPILASVIESYVTPKTIAWLALSRTRTVYRELGIACHPSECDTEDILRNATQLSADELQIASAISELVNSLQRHSDIICKNSVWSQYKL